MHQADAGDAETAHKWNLKQFIRLVPHAHMLAEHLAVRHLSQFLFTGTGDPVPEPAEEPKRFCHCAGEDGQGCPHATSVHVQMPGLEPEEDAQGNPQFVDRATRCTVPLDVQEETSPEFRAALQLMVANAHGVPLQEHPAIPEVVFRAQTMCLKWHDNSGVLECKDTFHASDDYYGGAWYDAVLAKHQASRRGGARRMLTERCAAEVRADASGHPIPPEDHGRGPHTWAVLLCAPQSRTPARTPAAFHARGMVPVLRRLPVH